MFLTRFLLGHRFRSAKVPGLQYAGKHRRFRFISKSMTRNMEQRLAIEEENAQHLSRPFLTKEEEFEHATVRRKEHAQDFLTKSRFANIHPNRYMDEHFAHLRISRKRE